MLVRERYTRRRNSPSCPNGEVLHARLILCEQQIVAQRRDELVATKLQPTVVSLCGRGKHLDNHRRIEERILLAVFSFRFAANDRDVGIGVDAERTNLDSYVAWIYSTWACARCIVQARQGSGDDEIVLPARVGHRRATAVYGKQWLSVKAPHSPMVSGKAAGQGEGDE